ncbi:MAG: DUF2089 domain-containing protein [Acholeplasmataceae bacterium]
MNQKTKRYPVITKCPVSKGDLHVTRLECEESGVIIEGNFELSKFNYLEPDKLYFIEVFIKNRGSIKAIEKELNISYPTVKKMLDEVIIGLGYELTESEDTFLKEPEASKSKTNVLEKLEKGEISFEEAMKLMGKGE